MDAEASFERKSFVSAHATRVFLDGSRRNEVAVGPARIGHGVYEPGWRWSEHARPLADKESAAHVGYVVSGRMGVRGPDGNEAVVQPGEAFYAAAGHDAWVVGTEPCVALDFAAD